MAAFSLPCITTKHTGVHACVNAGVHADVRNLNAKCRPVRDRAVKHAAKMELTKKRNPRAADVVEAKIGEGVQG